MSGERGTLRKVYDVGPKAITSTASYDGSGTPTTSWGAGEIASEWLTQLAQGVTDNDRVGFTIAIQDLEFTLIINPDITIGGHSVLRCIIVADNECDGVAPTLGEVLGNAGGAVGTGSTDTTIATGFVCSHLQPAYFSRFKVLLDEYWEWHIGLGGATPTPIDYPATNKAFVHRRHIPMEGHRVQWDMTDLNALANTRKGHIFMFFLYQNVTTQTGGLLTQTTTNPPSIQYMMRFRYHDA